MITFDAMGNSVKLVIDIGNTLTKISLFKNDNLTENHSVKGSFSALLTSIVGIEGVPYSCIISNVGMDEGDLIAAIEPVKTSKIVYLRSGMRLPVKVAYKTPETLGNDRLANACGAWALYPEQNSLVIDMGTCIKYDFVSLTGIYSGGSISPGLTMRYKALAHFTNQLPYFKPIDDFPGLTGQSTESAIRSGVENGILEEVNGIISRYRKDNDQTHIIITGGDSLKFADKLKSPIFVTPNLTITGLKVILDHNDQ